MASYRKSRRCREDQRRAPKFFPEKQRGSTKTPGSAAAPSASAASTTTTAAAMTGSIKLRDYPGDIVRLACDRCGRSGQYRKEKLITQFGSLVMRPPPAVQPEWAA
jgi:hypothetical protein